jgi:site-specific DNA-methyltransferase (adenine-specific)
VSKEISVVTQIVPVDIGLIRPYKNNARINDHVVPALMKSIERFGFNQPVVLDPNYEIICGHTRVKAAKQLGMKSVPCVFANNLTQDEINAYRLADNKLAEQALWDYEKLDEELKEVGKSISMTDFGFSAQSFSNINSFFEAETNEKTPTSASNEPGEGSYVAEPRLHKCPHCGEVFED